MYKKAILIKKKEFSNFAITVMLIISIKVNNLVLGCRLVPASKLFQVGNNMSDINGIQNQQNGFNQGISNNQATNMPGSSGMINGVAVEPADIQDSLFEDSLEEMTFAKDNSKQTKLAQRQQKNNDARIAELIKKMQEALLNKVNSKDKADETLQRARRAGCTPKDLIKGLRSFGDHDAESYALLLDLAQKEKDPKVAELLKDTAETLLSENPEGIKAVLNAIDVSEDNYAGFSALENAENYSDALLNFTDGLSMLKFITDKYGKDVNMGLDFINKALGADLEAAQMSHEPAFLRSVSEGLEHAKVLYSCFAHQDVLIERLNKIHGIEVGAFDKVDFVTKLSNLTRSTFIGPSDIRGLLDGVRSKDPAEEVVICQELSNTLKNLSDIFYGSSEARSKINEACILLIDDKIRAEDVWLESQQ